MKEVFADKMSRVTTDGVLKVVGSIYGELQILRECRYEEHIHDAFRWEEADEIVNQIMKRVP
jgi:hypothetical protein